jgi:hypothetical protein
MSRVAVLHAHYQASDPGLVTAATPAEPEARQPLNRPGFGGNL